MPVLRSRIDGSVGYIVFLVAGFGTLPSNHGIALRGKECSCGGRKAIAGGLAIDNYRCFATLAWYEITECDIVVGNFPFHAEFMLVGTFEVGTQTGCLVVDVFLLDLILRENAMHGVDLGRGNSETLGEIAYARLEAEWRRLENGFPVVGY